MSEDSLSDDSVAHRKRTAFHGICQMAEFSVPLSPHSVILPLGEISFDVTLMFYLMSVGYRQKISSTLPLGQLQLFPNLSCMCGSLMPQRLAKVSSSFF